MRTLNETRSPRRIFNQKLVFPVESIFNFIHFPSSLIFKNCTKKEIVNLIIETRKEVSEANNVFCSNHIQLLESFNNKLFVAAASCTELLYIN